MPFKIKIIKQVQKAVQATKIQSPNQDSSSEEKKVVAIRKHKSTLLKKLVDKNHNVFQLIYMREPTWDHHVVNFYNMVGLNQKAISIPDFEESKYTTIFYIKNAKKVEIKSNVVLIQLCNSSLSFPPIQYIIQRYRSFGQSRFYKLANLLEQAELKLKDISEVKLNESVEDTSDLFDKYVEQLGNKLFICRSTNNRLVISKSLLQLLQYDVEQFAIQIVKYKAPLSEIFTAERYFDIVYKLVENLKNLFDLISNKISLEAFLNNSCIRFKDHIITKSNKRIYCKLKVGMPNPILNLMEVEEVIQPLNVNSSNLEISRFSQNCQKIRKDRELADVKTIRRMIQLPKNILPENQHRVASYLCNVENELYERASQAH